MLEDAAGAQTAVPVRRGRLNAHDSGPLRAGALSDDLRSGTLVRVLPDWQAMIATQPSGIFGRYPPHHAVPRKVRVFLDFLHKKFGRTPYWKRGSPERSRSPPAERNMLGASMLQCNLKPRSGVALKLGLGPFLRRTA